MQPGALAPMLSFYWGIFLIKEYFFINNSGTNCNSIIVDVNPIVAAIEGRFNGQVGILQFDDFAFMLF